MKAAAIGFTYGVLFFPLFSAIAGGGHGLYFPIYAVCAPFSVMPIGILLTPLLAAALAWLSAQKPRWFLLAIAFHWLSAIFICARTYRAEAGEPYSRFDEKLAYFRWWIVALALIYLAGQVLLWFTFAKSSRRQLSSS